MVHTTCAALHCLSSSHTDKNLKFHQFPHDAERRKIWLAACKRSDVIDKDWDFFKHKYVCSLHFQKCMYSKKDRLKKSAIPSLHLSEKPLQHDSSTQTVESIQYVSQQSENDLKILYVLPNVEKSSTTTYTQTKDSLPDDIRHINMKREIITQTNIGESESVEQDVDIKTENDEDYGEDSDSEAMEEDVEMKIEIVENEILPLVQSTLFLQSADLEITKDAGTLSTQAKNLLQEINQGSKATILNRTESSVSTNPINTSMTPILKTKMVGSIQTDRVIVLSYNADGSEGSINPEECTCNKNEYVDMTRLQFYRACSKFLSANFAITVRRQMHLDDVNKQGGNKLSEAGTRSSSVKARAAECVKLNAAGCGGVVAPDIVIPSTETADNTEADLYAADRVEASAAASAADCARSTPFTELGMNLNPEGPILITSTMELTNTPQVSNRPKQELEQCKISNLAPAPRPPPRLPTASTSTSQQYDVEVVVEDASVSPVAEIALPLSPACSASTPPIVGPLERAAACDLDKEDRDVTGNYHVRQGVSKLSPPGSLQGRPRSCRTLVSEVHSGVTRKRKRKKKILVTASVAEGSEFDSDIDDASDLDDFTSSGGMARNIPDDDDLDESVSKIVNSMERAMDDAIDQLVGVPSHFNWRVDFDTFQGVHEDFSGPTPGPIEDYDTPYDAFTAIWTNDIIERVVIETNRYAKQVVDEKTKTGTLKPSSRLRFWTDTDKDEVYMFFAIHMLMGLDRRTTQQEFWKSTGYLEMPKFRKLMNYRRFLLLSRCFHLEDNSGASQDLPQSGGIGLPAKLRKIAPIVGHLNNKFSNLYNLHADIVLDESLTKGRLSWVQAIRSKTAWDGTKSYELCDSSTGYLYKFEIYTGKNSKQGNFSSLSEALAEKSTHVVMDLLTGLETRGHCITMDNVYNSPALARHLKSLGFDCLGTLRPNRKNVPLEIKNVPKNVAKGTTIARHCGDVSCIAWKDNKVVTMISTYHTSETYIDRRTSQELVKPVVIRDYNNTMKGVNLKDQKLSMYLFERKRTKRCLKWYMKIFIRLLNVSVRNAFILLSDSLNRRGMPFPTDRDFREELANSLLANRRFSPGEITAPIEEKYTRLRKDKIHVPKYHADNADRWRCFICHRKGIQKMVNSSCVTCNEFICFEGCWSDWHSLQELPLIKNVSCRKRKRCA